MPVAVFKKDWNLAVYRNLFRGETSLLATSPLLLLVTHDIGTIFPVNFVKTYSCLFTSKQCCGGEYTEYDTDNSNSDVSGDDTCSKPKQPKTSSGSGDQTYYTCPECKKQLKTIAGFRGHVKKQHNIDAKASENKTFKTSVLKSEKKHFQFSGNDFDTIFPTAFSLTLSNIENDPFLLNDDISVMCKFASSSETIRTILGNRFKTIFVTSSTNLTTSCDREQLFRQLHCLRSDHTLKEEITELCLTFTPHCCEFVYPTIY
ncbi:uncharacterized protein LOC134726215 [Mytilus trossulus]|uniref:uncharacterized protein LOC134726215 n=1 Tax=Mytilus trossulus TaxID=6551 RepID=UPI003006B390